MTFVDNLSSSSFDKDRSTTPICDVTTLEKVYEPAVLARHSATPFTNMHSTNELNRKASVRSNLSVEVLRETFEDVDIESARS